MTGVLGRISTAKSDVSKIPDGPPDGSLTLVYEDPIDANPTSPSLTSTFVAILGKQSNAASDVGIVYQVLTVFGSFMSVLASAASSFTGSVGDFKNNFQGVSDSISDVTSQI